MTPATQVLPQWAIFLGDYNPAGPFHWMSQAKFDPSLGTVAIDMGPKSLTVCPGGTTGNQFGVVAPLVVGTWTELRYDIDTTADRVQVWYNNQPVGQLWQLSEGISAGLSINGATFGTIDLYANGNTLAGDRGYWDDVTITANADTNPLGCIGQSEAFCVAGTSTNGCVPVIITTGTPSATAAAGFSISLTVTEGNKSGLFFYSRTGQQALPWGASSSFLCLKAPTQRTPASTSTGTTGLCDGDYSTLDFNTYMATNAGAVGNPRFVGEVFDGQFWYRDPPSPKTTNLSAGVRFTLAP